MFHACGRHVNDQVGARQKFKRKRKGKKRKKKEEEKKRKGKKRKEMGKSGRGKRTWRKNGMNGAWLALRL
jgi:hypothetical protein